MIFKTIFQKQFKIIYIGFDHIQKFITKYLGNWLVHSTNVHDNIIANLKKYGAQELCCKMVCINYVEVIEKNSSRQSSIQFSKQSTLNLNTSKSSQQNINVENTLERTLCTSLFPSYCM